MTLSREAIVEQLKEIVGPQQVVTDEAELKRSSHDRFRKYADIHGVYTLPIPAAVVKLQNTQQVSDVLAFMNRRVPVLQRLKVGWKPPHQTRWCWMDPV